MKIMLDILTSLRLTCLKQAAISTLAKSPNVESRQIFKFGKTYTVYCGTKSKKFKDKSKAWAYAVDVKSGEIAVIDDFTVLLGAKVCTDLPMDEIRRKGGAAFRSIQRKVNQITKNKRETIQFMHYVSGIDPKGFNIWGKHYNLTS